VSEESITEAVERLLEVRIRLGMMKKYPSPYADISYDKVECKEHIRLSLEAARRSMVLLKNKNNILPLDQSKIKTIAVIGPNANSRDGLMGNYTGTSSQYITPIEGIQNYVGEDTKVLYAEGCHLYKEKVEFLAEEKDRFAEAVITAEQADVVIMCLGLDATIEGEEGDAGNEYASGDKLGLNLPGLQQELLECIAATKKPIILVVSAGSALDLSWAEENIDGILYAWYPGARGGKAVAELLFGEYAPTGKLPVTFFKGTENLPDFCDYSMINRTYRYATSDILYPFGYGLGYSKVSYRDAEVSTNACHMLDEVKLMVTVKNEGSYDVHEIVQAYIKYEKAGKYDPGFQLKGIQCVDLKAGESKRVEIMLSARDFATITEEGKCVIKPGQYILTIGGQQPDARSNMLTGQEVSTFPIEKKGEETEVEY
jgi:beta-glucosidase